VGRPRSIWTSNGKAPGGVSGGGGMATDNDRAPYVISGVMADGAPYTANGTMQPDGSVLFRVPHRARVKDFPSRTTDQRSTFS